jgi:hypothetical protein
MNPYLLLMPLATLTLWTAFAQVPNGNTPAAYTVITEGSTPTHRSQVDSDSGEVYIYVGGSFPAGTYPTEFVFLFSFAGLSGNTTGYITPLLFERVPGEVYTYYVVAAIGEGFPVSINTLPQAIPFKILEGYQKTPAANFTFGYVNSMVNASGVPTASSAGTVDLNNNPPDSGEGVGGTGTTNHWMVTDTRPSGPTVGLGTTFAAPGAGANYSFYQSFRTYSAQAYGIISTQ